MSFSLLDVFLSTFGLFLIFWSIFGFKIRISLFFRFSVFFAGSSLILFTIFPHFLRYLGELFGLSRGADLLVYFSVAFLLYSILLLLKRDEILSQKLTKTIRQLSFSVHKDINIKTKTTVIIPAYNEAKVLEKTIEDIFRFDKDLVVLVIDDGSSDDTEKVLSLLKNRFPRLISILHVQNLGQGAALETGFEYIRRGYIQTDFVVTFDADGQMRIDDIAPMIAQLEKCPDIDIVLGSRFLGTNPKNMPFIRKIILKGGVIFTRFVSGISLSDTHNGFRVFRANVLFRVYITLDGMGHASEIIDIISSEKISFKEFPVQITYTDYSLRKGQKTTNSIKVAFKMISKKIF